jgi:ABC-type branched-subunit amino acid transport system substrate-binding protein
VALVQHDGGNRRCRGVFATVAAIVAVAALALAVVPVAGAAAATQKPTATDVGITAGEFHVAIVADVDSPLAPNLFIGDVLGTKAVAKYLNAHGGLAGRKVVVEFYDSKLDAADTRNAVIQACESDAVMSGTSAVFLTSVDEMRGCKDAKGQTTGIPDLPAFAPNVSQQCSDQSFPVIPPALLCDTKDQHPQTYQTNVQRAYYYQGKFGKDLHGIYIFNNASKAAHDALYAQLGGLREVGITSDADFDEAANAQQSVYTQIVQTMKTKGSNYAQCTLPYTCTVQLRKEAVLQGLSGVKVWDCTVQCYDERFPQAGGADVEGTYVAIPFMPYLNKADQKAVPMVGQFVKYMGKENLSSGAAYSWAAGLALRDAVEAQVAAGGVNSVTRATIFDQLRKLHDFDADGMFAPIDLAGRQLRPCGVINQVRGGAIVRVEPKKAGTFACSPKNGRLLWKLDLIKS